MTAATQGMRLIFVVGCPGSGKGTLCARSASQWGWSHISVGDELRRYIQESPEKNKSVARYVETGTLVPLEELAKILDARIQNLKHAGHHTVMIDGFPRHVSQIENLQGKIGEPDLVLFFDCHKQTALERILSRKNTIRAEDEEMFEKRYNAFACTNPAILKYFEDRGKLHKVSTNHDTKLSFVLLQDVLQTALGRLDVELPSGIGHTSNNDDVAVKTNELL